MFRETNIIENMDFYDWGIVFTLVRIRHTKTHTSDLILMKINRLFELALKSQHNNSRIRCLLTKRETLHSSQVFNQDQCSKLLWLLLFWVGLLSMCVYQCCSLLEGTGASDSPVCWLTHSALVGLIRCVCVCLISRLHFSAEDRQSWLKYLLHQNLFEKCFHLLLSTSTPFFLKRAKLRLLFLNVAVAH